MTRFDSVLLGGTLTVAALVAVALMPPLAAASGVSGDQPLEIGVPVAAELGAGQSHVYIADLTAGAWSWTVEQQDVDVEIEIATAEGENLGVVDSPLDRRGIERFVVVAEARSYRATVRAREPVAPPGRYEIRVAAQPRQTAEDRRRLAALRASFEAGKHYAQGTTVGRRLAAEHYEAAADHWRSVGEVAGEARATYCLAVLLRLLDENARALAVSRQAWRLWQSLDEPFWAANSLTEMGLNQWLVGDGEAAAELFGQALEIHRRLGEPFGEGVARSNLCLLHLTRGELRPGLDCYLRALPLLQGAQAAEPEATARSNVGRVYNLLGEPEAAREQYDAALALMRSIGDLKGEARTLNNLGVLLRSMGQPQDALAHYTQALDVFLRLEDRRWQARVLNNIGLVYLGLGEPQRAISHLRQALALRRELGDGKGEATTLSNLGLAHSRSGEDQEALDLQRQALALRRASNDRRGEAVVLHRLGQVEAATGDAAAASATFEQALEILRTLADRSTQAIVLRRLGEARLTLGQSEAGLENLGQALAMARAAGHQSSEAETLYALARAEHRQGRFAASRESIEAALEIVETLRTRISSPELRAAYSSMQHRAYELQIDLLMGDDQPASSPDPAAAFLAAERARARSLLEMLNESGADIRRGVDRQLLAQRNALLRRLSAKAEIALEKGAPAAEQQAILRQLDTVEARIRQTSPGYSALTQPVALDVAGAMGLLDADTVLLSFSLGEARSFVWALDIEGWRSFELTGRGEIERAVRRFHDQLSRFDVAARRDQARSADELSRLLLRPIADVLQRRRLAIIADGALHYLPFGALPLPVAEGPGSSRGAAVLEQHEVVYLPSASTLAAQRRLVAGRHPATRQLAIFADPVFARHDARVGRSAAAAGKPRVANVAPTHGFATRGGKTTPGSFSGEMPTATFERLPATRREAQAILELAPPGDVLKAFDFDASREQVLTAGLGDYRILHFATHGVFDGDHPMSSSLALSLVEASGRPQPGLLGLQDIYNLDLAAELVVLSGCRTALGREMRGEGLVGLARGFLYAGTPRLVASLWQVEDRATAELMQRFYRGLWRESLPPAAALRQAQLSIRQERRWRDPYFWAGFVLIGDWT
ncbi:MAG: CHAT domain-containing tetratricopeptide repeat protein [Acidobacteriota bacterium]